MGCAVSSVSQAAVPAGMLSSDPTRLTTVWNITDEEKEIMKGSWHYLKKDLTNNGLGIFLRIFKMSPKSKKLFGLQMDDDENDINTMPTIRGHAARFMQAIGAAVENLDDLEHALTGILIQLGEQHKRIPGFVPDQFDVFYDAMMGQWTAVLGNEFNSSVLDAWGHLFVFMMVKLKEGYLKAS